MPQAKKKSATVRKPGKKVAVVPQARIRATRSAAAAADVRDALLKAALNVLAEEGLEAATVKRIAAVAGVNHGLVHYYFGSKEAMLLEAFNTVQRRELDDVRERLGDRNSKNTLSSLRTLMREGMRDSWRVKVSAQLTALSMYNPELTSGINQINQQLSVALGDILTAHLGRKPRPSDAIAARLMMGGLVTLSLWSLRENPKELDEAFDMLTRMISGELARK